MFKISFKILFYVVLVILVFFWFVNSIFALSIGCPPPPFLHNCLKERYIHDCLIRHECSDYPDYE